MRLQSKLLNRKSLTRLKKTHLKPCMMKAVNRVPGEASVNKMQHVSLSNNTIQRRISKMHNMHFRNGCEGTGLGLKSRLPICSPFSSTSQQK